MIWLSCLALFALVLLSSAASLSFSSSPLSRERSSSHLPSGQHQKSAIPSQCCRFELQDTNSFKELAHYLLEPLNNAYCLFGCTGLEPLVILGQESHSCTWTGVSFLYLDRSLILVPGQKSHSCNWTVVPFLYLYRSLLLLLYLNKSFLNIPRQKFPACP